MFPFFLFLGGTLREQGHPQLTQAEPAIADQCVVTPLFVTKLLSAQTMQRAQMQPAHHDLGVSPRLIFLLYLLFGERHLSFPERRV